MTAYGLTTHALVSDPNRPLHVQIDEAAEVIRLAAKLGTYPISIIPDQDCCTLFTPRNPLTRAKLSDIEGAEQSLAIDELVERAVVESIVEDFEFPARRTRAGKRDDTITVS